MRNRGSAKVTAVVVFAIVGIMVVSPMPTYIQKEISQVGTDLMTILPGFLSSFATAKDLGPLPATAQLTVGVAVAPPDPGAADAYVYELYAPGSPYYHHFLSPTEYRSMFSPSPAAYASVESYYASYGLTLQPTPDRLMLGLVGTSDRVAQAFHTSFDKYSYNGQVVYGASAPVSVPGNLPISAVTGMSNAVGPKPLDVSPSAVEASLQQVIHPKVNSTPGAWTCTTSQEGCWLSAYYGEVPLFNQGYTGTGVTVGIVDAYDSSTTQSSLSSAEKSWASGAGLPTPKENFLYPIPHTANLNTSSSSGWGGETELDEEMVDTTSPGATIDVAFATDSSFAVYEVVDYLVANNVSQTISMSWGEADVGTMYAPPQNPCMPYYSCNASWDGSYGFLHPVFAEAVAEGITPFSAAGDCGAADGTAGDATDYPSSDPFVVGVGGTNPNGSGTTYGGETGWGGNGSMCTSNTGGGGGGYAPFPQPWWQHGPGQLTHNLRGDPDVSCDADDGTSQASPMWAGWMAVADQIHGSGLGLVGPAMYSILRNATEYKADFHDIKTGNNGYKAGVGWDPITGIGTPIASALLPALAAYKPTYFGNLNANMTASPVRGTAPLTVTLTATVHGGTPPYHYDFIPGLNMGEWTSLSTISYKYASAGVYQAMVTVFDSAGNSTTSQPVIVNPGGSALTATLSASATTVNVGQLVNFTATAGGGTSPYQYTYYYGDGTYGYNGTTTNSHAYRSPGTFCPSLFAADSKNNGGFANATCISVTIPSVVPIISSFSANPPTIGLGNATYLNVSAYGGTGTLSYNYTGLPTGCSTQNVLSLKCTPTATGTFTVRVFVNDSGGHSVSITTSLLVNPSVITISSVAVSPTAPTVAAGGNQVFTATPKCSSTCPPSGVSYVWALTSTKLGSISPASSPTTTFTAGATAGTVGLYVNATLTGTTVMTSTVITVTPPPVTISSVSLTPTAPSVPSLGTQLFTATPKCSATCPTPLVTYVWNLTSTKLGSIAPATGITTTFTAGTTAGTVGLFVNATLNGTVEKSSALITVTVIYPTVLNSVAIAPSTASLLSGAEQNFTLTPTCTNDGNSAKCPSETTYSWSLNNSNGNISSGSGSYTKFTAGYSSSVVGLTGKATLNGTTEQSVAVITIVAQPVLSTVTISPASVSLATGTTQIFTPTPACTLGTSSTKCPSGVTYSWALNSSLGTVSPSTGATTTFAAGNNSGVVGLTVTATLNGIVVLGHATITISKASPVQSVFSGMFMWLLIAAVIVVVAVVVVAVLVRRHGKGSAAVPPPPPQYGQAPGGDIPPWPGPPQQ
jgi:kumamolisin